MDKTNVLKQAKVLWLSNFVIALSPLFFTVLILELDKYERVRELLVNRFSGYQQVVLVAMVFLVVVMAVYGCKLYAAIALFTSIGEGLSKDEIFSSAGRLKYRLTLSLRIAGFGFMLVTAIYITGMSYLYVFVLAMPSAITYFLCLKIYYLRLA